MPTVSELRVLLQSMSLRMVSSYIILIPEDRLSRQIILSLSFILEINDLLVRFLYWVILSLGLKVFLLVLYCPQHHLTSSKMLLYTHALGIPREEHMTPRFSKLDLMT
jgi:hypothetical protein